MFIENVGLNVSDTVHENVTTETLERAANIFIYLNFCPKLLTWKRFLEDLLASSSLQTILKTLNRMVRASARMQDGKNSKVIIAKHLLNKLNSKFGLKYKSINSDLSGDAIKIKGIILYITLVSITHVVS